MTFLKFYLKSTDECMKLKSPEIVQVQERLVSTLGRLQFVSDIGLKIRTHASPKVGQDHVSGGVSALCYHAALLQMLYV